MSQWYCYVNGQKYGPVSQEVLHGWVVEGRVRPTDNVWCEGMSDWAPAQSALPDWFGPSGSIPPPPPPQTSSLVPSSKRGGTSGQTPNGQITAKARRALKGRWGMPILFSLLLGLLRVSFATPYIGSLAALVLAGPLTLGGIVFYMTFVRGGRMKLEMMFAGFKNFANALIANLLIGIFVFLWSLLLIIPGIIAALGYSQTFYILAEDRGIDGLEAMRRSKRLMQGSKWKLFCLHLRFIGWGLLCILTLGIGYLWLTPYMQTSYATFYEDLLPPPAAQESSPQTSPAGVIQSPYVRGL